RDQDAAQPGWTMRSEPIPDAPSPDADSAFVQGVVSKASTAGADQAQARLSHDQLVEVDFDTRHVDMLRTTRNDDTLLTVFKGGRKGSATITGREAGAVAGAVAEALAAAEAAPPDPAHGLAESAPGPATTHGPASADQEHMIDAARAHIEQMA